MDNTRFYYAIAHENYVYTEINEKIIGMRSHNIAKTYFEIVMYEYDVRAKYMMENVSADTLKELKAKYEF